MQTENVLPLFKNYFNTESYTWNCKWHLRFYQMHVRHMFLETGLLNQVKYVKTTDTCTT